VLLLVLQLKQSTRALVATTFEIGRLSSLFRELCIPIQRSPLILCGNIGATQLSLNLAYHSRKKHVTIDLYFVREYVAKGLLNVHHQLADLRTKAHPRSRFEALRFKIGINDGESILQGRVKDSSSNHPDNNHGSNRQSLQQ
jgi:hypothetical protein